MARFWACVSQVLTKMVGDFCSIIIFEMAFMCLYGACTISSIMSCHILTFYGVKRMKNLSEVTTRNELADFLGVPIKKLTHILYIKKPDTFYEQFEIPKKSGEPRIINAPTGALKSIQKRLLFAIEKTICDESGNKSNISHAFEKNKSIITNAKIHRNKKIVMNFDLNDFFGSFHFGRVCGFFQKNRYFNLPYEVAVAITQLVCFNGSLPQGAPTSPIITNLISQIMDIRLLKLAKKYRLDFTRYADDLTFSTNDKNILGHYDEFYKQLELEINSAGFKINEEKTRLQFRDSQQMVTGLTVNKKIQVPRNYYKKTRAMAHSLYKSGSYTINGEPGTLNQLEGRFSFIDQLTKYNNKIDGQKHRLSTFCTRETDYQKFLFYKYFFAAEKPLLVTEGQTDITYLKAALKNLYLEYPSLISKKKDGTFEFKISFLNRTDRLSYFLGFSKDGADAMGCLYNFFIKSKEHLNYYEYFLKTSGSKATYPVIFVFDNELESKGKPLKKFFDNYAKDEEAKEKIKTQLYVHLLKSSNIYLVTNPILESSSKEAEIEHLFSKDVLETKIEGKPLSLSGDYDKSKYYGKVTFSKHIMNNYKSIDFSNFRIILDNIAKILKEYNES